MSFFQSADAYDRFMGRYSTILAPGFADLAGIEHGQRVVDVGCGPGELTAELVKRVGADHVAAVDPSQPFVDAVRERYPGVDVQAGTAEQLPHPDGVFDAAVSQLVVHFMQDAVAGVRDMARVTRPGGVVAACTWDLAGNRSPLAPFWMAVNQVDPNQRDESERRGGSEEDLAAIFAHAGLAGAATTELVVEAHHESFDEWWEPFELGVGPASAYLTTLGPDKRDAIRERAQEFVPDEPHTIQWYAWAARATV